jgi:hypothetical protein
MGSTVLPILEAMSGYAAKAIAGQQGSAARPARLATIADDYEFGDISAQVTFDGESDVSGNFYPISAAISVVAEDRVLLEPIGNTYMITAIVDNGLTPRVPIARVTHAGGQNVLHNTSTAITWDTAEKNDFGLWSSGANTRLTVPRTGWWNVKANIQFNATNGATSNHAKSLLFRVNGTTFKGGNQIFTSWGASVAQINSLNASEDLYMTATDYMEIIALQTSGSTLATGVINGANWFTIRWLHI